MTEVSRMSPGTRVYCFMMGRSTRADDKGECPECGPYINTHRVITSDDCESFVACRVRPSIFAGEVEVDHGHPCELPAGHDGECAAPEARRSCVSPTKDGR